MSKAIAYSIQNYLLYLFVKSQGWATTRTGTISNFQRPLKIKWEITFVDPLSVTVLFIFVITLLSYKCFFRHLLRKWFLPVRI